MMAPAAKFHMPMDMPKERLMPRRMGTMEVRTMASILEPVPKEPPVRMVNSRYTPTGSASAFA